MLWRLLGLFVVVPLVELVLLIEIGRRIGTVYTILLVIGTGFVGAFLAKSQGLAVLSRIKQESMRGEVPTSALADGLMILIAGAVLLTPGVLTDALGLLLLLPWFRGRVKQAVAIWISRMVQGQITTSKWRR